MSKKGFVKNILKSQIGHHQVYKEIVQSGLFDSEYYLFKNLEVARACINPVKHYLQDGYKQGKDPNPYFDTDWYLETYPDVFESGMNPLYHYICQGWKVGYDPSPRFSVREYLKQHPELMEKGSEPLRYYMRNQNSELEVIDFNQITTNQEAMHDVGKVAVHAHIYYADLTAEFVEYMNRMPVQFDCFITTDTPGKKKIIHEITGDHLKAHSVSVRVAPNIGRDIAPFVVGCKNIINDYEFICHIHTKKALHTSEDDYGNTWRKDLLEHLLGSQQQIRAILNYFNDAPNVGLLFPKNFIPIQKYLEFDVNQWNLEYLAERVGLKLGAPREIICPAGSMFWARAKALKKLYDAELMYKEFDGEAGQLDGTLAHAFERLFVYFANSDGYASRIIGSRVY